MNHTAILIKEARVSKGITQQELADLTGISLRSVQRIENGEVTPRAYTLRTLYTQLGLQENFIPDNPVNPDVNKQKDNDQVFATGSSLKVNQLPLSTAQKILLSTGIAVLLIMATLAFIFQSPRFPETAFETILLWIPIVIIYTGILFRIWR